MLSPAQYGRPAIHPAYPNSSIKEGREEGPQTADARVPFGADHPGLSHQDGAGKLCIRFALEIEPNHILRPPWSQMHGQLLDALL